MFIIWRTEAELSFVSPALSMDEMILTNSMKKRAKMTYGHDYRLMQSSVVGLMNGWLYVSNGRLMRASCHARLATRLHAATFRYL